MLYYITRVKIDQLSAQSVQINKMCEAFYTIKKFDFCLITTGKKIPSKYNTIFVNTINAKKAILQVIFLCKIIYLSYKFKIFKNKVITRDIMVAFTMSLIGTKTIYELHQAPNNIFNQFVLKIISKKKIIKFIAISQSLKNYYIDKYKINSNKIIVLHDAVDIDLIEKILTLEKKSCKLS